AHPPPRARPLRHAPHADAARVGPLRSAPDLRGALILPRALRSSPARRERRPRGLMRIFRDAIERIDASEGARRAVALEPVASLVELGMIEQAALDALHPRADELDPIERALDRAVRAAAL